MNQHLILLCDDNPAIPKTIAGYLEETGMKTIIAETGSQAIDIFNTKHPDLIVLDVMLPDMSGHDVCREIRRTSEVPILMLSAKGEEVDRILGLELGADDYVTKPFSPHEVAIRIKKLLKRSIGMNSSGKYTVAELTVLPDSFEVFVADRKVSLSAKEFEVLKCLAYNVGKVRTREQLINTVWGDEYIAEPRIVDTLIKRLRHKLFDESNEELHFDITTVFGVGYKLEAVEKPRGR